MALSFPALKRFCHLLGFTTVDYNTLFKWTPIMLTIGFMYVAVGLFFWSGLCMCIKGDDIPGVKVKSVHLSTAIMRAFMQPTCLFGSFACMVYATLPENALNQVFINFHINLES